MDIKKVVLSIALLTCMLEVFSQVKFGVRAGVGYYRVPQSSTGAILSKYNSIKPEIDQLDLQYAKTDGIGYNFGLFLDYSLTKAVGIQIEPSVSLRNYNEVLKNFSENQLASVISENYIYNELIYLDLPLLFKLNLSPNTGKYGRNSYFSIFAGPQFGLFLGKTESNVVTTSVTIYDQTTVNTSNSERPGKFNIDYNTLDIAAVVGGMYDFEKGLRFGARYVGSLMPVTQNINFDSYHHSFQLTVGYNFIPQKRRKRRR